jgi:L-ascorbate metabolism protein UlaG (beta-lactamase superfamily)
MIRLLFALLLGATTGAWAQVAPVVTSLKTSKGTLKITSITHGSLLFQFAGKTIYVDPWSQVDLSSYPKADWIFMTHDHADHHDPKALAMLKKADTQMVANEVVAKQEPGTAVMKNGDRKVFGGVPVEAVPMYNFHPTPDGTTPHPKGVGNGYIFTFGGKRIYVAGDTGCTPEMKELKNIDLAFLPMFEARTMTPEEAAECARVFRPKVMYAYHYRNNDPTIAQRLLKDSGVDARIGAASPPPPPAAATPSR